MPQKHKMLNEELRVPIFGNGQATTGGRDLVHFGAPLKSPAQKSYVEEWLEEARGRGRVRMSVAKNWKGRQVEAGPGKPSG